MAGVPLGALHLVGIRPGLDAEHVTDQLAAHLLRLFGLPAQKAQESATWPLLILPGA